MTGLGARPALMDAALGWCDHIAEVLHRSGAHKELPVGSPGRGRKGRRQAQDLGALCLQDPEKLRKTYVVTDREPDAPHRRRNDHRL